MRPVLRFPASSKPPPPDSSQRLGYPLPGWVSTLFQYMYSRPLRLVHWVLQAVVQVWQPMHLFRSMTIASCRFDIVFSSGLGHIHRRLVGNLIAIPLRTKLEMPPAAGEF